MSTLTRRLSMPLSERDERDLALLRSDEARRLHLPGEVAADSSDATLAHAVFEAGLNAIKEQAAAVIYREMATDAELVREARANRFRLAARGRDTVND